jgi:putative membrane protein (TIGR04086 family)
MQNQAGQGVKAALNEHVGLMMILKGILVSYIITIPVFIIFAFILSCTDFPTKYVNAVVIIVTIASIVVAGAVSTRKVKSKGWLNGGIVGFLYILILYFLGSIVFNNFRLGGNVISMLIIGVLMGAVGGIIGINLRHKSRH